MAAQRWMVTFVLLVGPSEVACEQRGFRAGVAVTQLVREHSELVPGVRRLSARRVALGLRRLSSFEDWPKPRVCDVLSLSPKERESLRCAARASVLASASYSVFGALLVAWTRNPWTALGTWWRLLRGVLHIREAAFEAHTRSLGLQASDLLHAQWRSRWTSDGASQMEFTPAHYIVIDHEERCVTLAVRGTMDVTDAVADLQLLPSALDRRLFGRGCHGGMASAARLLVEEHQDLLQHTLRLNRGYRLEVCGHSRMEHARIHPYIHTYMPTCLHAYMPTRLHAYMPTCLHAYMHTCIHAYMHTCIQVRSFARGGRRVVRGDTARPPHA